MDSPLDESTYRIRAIPGSKYVPCVLGLWRDYRVPSESLLDYQTAIDIGVSFSEVGFLPLEQHFHHLEAHAFQAAPINQ